MSKLYRAINEIDDDLIENALEISVKKPIYLKKYIGIVALFAVIIGGFSLYNNSKPPVIDLTDRILVEEIFPSAESSPFPEISGSMTFDVVVNIEGIITDVGEDGLSFKLDNGKWVYVTDSTIIGQTCTTIEQKESLLFEPTFRVGNMISGFTLAENTEKIEAYAIYTNWNFENPIKK